MKTITVKGMSCGHCVKAVEEILKDMDGVQGIVVDLDSGTASFEETAPVDMSDLEERIKKAGYEIG